MPLHRHFFIYIHSNAFSTSWCSLSFQYKIILITLVKYYCFVFSLYSFDSHPLMFHIFIYNLYIVTLFATTHMLMNRLMPLVLLLSVLLLLSPYSALAADSASGCYGPTTVKLSPRTCDSASKNCNVPITVSAEHKPGMSLCFQGIDTTYELYPVNATAFAVFSDPTRTCRPLVPSTSVTSIKDPCFKSIDSSIAKTISDLSVKQQGTYTVCSTRNTLGICSTGALGEEQDCTDGLHTWMATCDTAGCANGHWQVGSYYCPELKTYSIASLQYGQFDYTFEMKASRVSSDTPPVVSREYSTSASGDQPNPYNGWTRIINHASRQYFARPKHVEDGNCNDYCAMMLNNGGDFHTNNTCSKLSGDLCAPSRQITWQEFDPAQDEGSVALPYTAQDSSVLTERSFTTYSIVNPFIYTIDIKLDAAPADPEITTACGNTGAAGALDVGVEAQQYPRPDLLYVRRVCDQVVLSLGHCVLRYSHRDDSAMYWTVENRGNSSECAVHVVDGAAARQVTLSVAPMAERRASGSESSKKLPAWVIAVIVVVAVVVIAAVVIAVLCICPCTRGPLMGFFHCKAHDKESANAKRTALNPLQASAFCAAVEKLEESEENFGSKASPTPPPTSASPPPSPAAQDAATNEEASLSSSEVDSFSEDDALSVLSVPATEMLPRRPSPEPVWTTGSSDEEEESEGTAEEEEEEAEAEARPPALTHEERKALLLEEPSFGLRVLPSPPASPPTTPDTTGRKRRVRLWQCKDAASGAIEEIPETKITPFETPKGPVPLSNEEPPEKRPYVPAELKWNSYLTMKTARGQMGGWWSLGTSVEMSCCTSRLFAEPDCSGAEVPADPPVEEEPALQLRRSDVNVLLYLVVHVGFANHNEKERNQVMAQMRHDWGILESIVLDTSHRVVPLLPLYEPATMKTVIPRRWEKEFIRTVARSADYAMFYEEREVFKCCRVGSSD